MVSSNDLDQKVQGATDSMDTGDIQSAGGDELQPSDASGDALAGDNEEIIDLTEVADDVSAENGSLHGDDEPIDLDIEATEEEDIIELVDAAEGEPEEGEEILELVDEVDDDVSPGDAEGPDMTATEPGADEDDVADLESSLGMEDIAMEVEEPQTAGTFEAPGPGTGTGEVYDAESAPDAPDQDEPTAAGVSEEKLEAMITKVVREMMEEKADRILLEVAEAAIAREIDKIKKAL